MLFGGSNDLGFFTKQLDEFGRVVGVNQLHASFFFRECKTINGSSCRSALCGHHLEWLRTCSHDAAHVGDSLLCHAFGGTENERAFYPHFLNTIGRFPG